MREAAGEAELIPSKDLFEELGLNSDEIGPPENEEHCVELRRISVQELRDAFASGEVIEDYPDDKYGPSSLVLGFTETGRALHVQCSYPSRPLVKVITVYEPDPSLWMEYRERRR